MVLEPSRRLSGLRVRAVHQRLSAGRRDGGDAHDGARAGRPVRRAPADRRAARDRGGRRRHRASGWSLARRGAAGRAARRDVARDRAPDLDRAERPDRRIVPRRRDGSAARPRAACTLARRARGRARDRHEGQRALRAAVAARGGPARAACRRPREACRGGCRGTALGGTWYLVNRHQTGSLDGGFPRDPRRAHRRRGAVADQSLRDRVRRRLGRERG